MARPWARSTARRPARLAQRLRHLRRGGDPDRPVEGAGDVGGQHLGDRDRLLRPADLGELDPGQVAGAERDRPLGVGAALDALVAGERDRGRRRQLGRLLQPRHRLLGELDVELLQLGQRALGGVSTSQAALASTRIRAPAPTASRTARTWPASSPDAELELEGREALRGPAQRVCGDRRRLAGDQGRVAADRLAGRSARSAPPAAAAPVRAGPSARSAPRSGPAPRGWRRRRRRPSSSSSESSASSSSSRTTRPSVAPPRSDNGTASPSPTSPSSARSRSSTISRGRGCRARSRRARGTAARRG